MPNDPTTTGTHERPAFPKRAVVTGGMPYGNKDLHFGHISGVFVPADFYARFLRDRIGAENVVFVSGTDCYGSPIMEGYRKKVEDEGYAGTIVDYVEANHARRRSARSTHTASRSTCSPAAPWSPPARSTTSSPPRSRRACTTAGC